MSRWPGAGIWAALAWLMFPLVPAVLEDVHHGICNPMQNDPHQWGWVEWVVMAGPLVGFGFLAGATLGLPDDPGRRGVRGWLSRRTVWVGVGPWVGLLVWAAAGSAVEALKRLFPSVEAPAPVQEVGRAWSGAAFWAYLIGMIGLLSYGWLPLAIAAVRRAGRGRRRGAIGRGLATAVAFVGSLFGGFWAIVESWRSFFFDTRPYVPLVLMAVGLAAMSGCAATPTYGEVRRRELFHAMLLSWTIGLALIWRWWGRPRTKPPQP
jgi:hypothetical protein